MWNDLLDCLDLHDLTPGEASPDPSREDGKGPALTVFEGRNQKLSYHRVFGGQILAQFARAAALVTPGKAVKSLHVLFPRAGRSDEPIRFEVERHHEGGTFATLGITARQSKGVVATASVSLHSAEDGPDHQTVPAASGPIGEEHRADFDLIPWETRADVDLNSPKSSPPQLDVWMKTPPVGAEFAPGLTAYATDLNLIGTALLPVENVSQRDAQKAFTSAVTSHTLWFHRPFRCDEWLLLRQHSPILAHGRCFGRGDVLTADGGLVASFAQEALLRFAE
ncbi:acyl-CoA thioesterase [Actinomadura rugatobispora]|uniref:Acyl-CoA thioesterase n=1 Tax=Actinomadura rugatobispora TaxID=1994 RepID=A0ABW1AF63_9ACTN